MRCGRIASCLKASLAGLKSKARAVAMAIAYTPQSLEPFCFGHLIILMVGLMPSYENKFCTTCNESLST